MRFSFSAGVTWRARATVRWNTSPTVSTDNFLRISDGGDIVTTGSIVTPGYVIPTSVVYGSTPQIIGATNAFSIGEIFGPTSLDVRIPNSAKVGDHLVFVGKCDPSVGSSIGDAIGFPFTIVPGTVGSYETYAYRRVTGPEIGLNFTSGIVGAVSGRIYVIRGLGPFPLAEKVSATGSSTVTDPPSISPSWGTANGSIILAVIQTQVTGGGSPGTSPAGYDYSEVNFTFNILGTDFTNTYGVLGKTAGNVASDNPGAFGSVVTNWTAVTFAFKGADPLRVRTNYRVVQPGVFTNAQTFYSPTISGVAQVKNPPVYANASTFFTPKIVATLKPSAFTNTQTFPSSKIIATLKPAVLTNTQTFQTPKVNRTVKPAVLTNTQTFFSPKIVATLKPAVLANSQTFQTPKVNRTLTPSVFANGQTFFAPTLRFTLKPSALTNTQTFQTQKIRVTVKPAVLTNTSTLFAPTVTVAGAPKVPATYVNTQTFFSPRLVVTLKPVALTNAQAFQTQKIVRTLKPATLANAQTFFGPTLKLTVKAGTYANLPVIFAPTLNTPVKVLPALYVNAQVFYGPSIVTVAARRPEVMWPELRRRKKRVEAEAETDVTPPIPSESERDRAKRKKWARGDFRDALTEALGPLPELAPEPVLEHPGLPAIGRNEILAEQARQKRLRDDEEAMALIMALL
jgi:hypothetical protein